MLLTIHVHRSQHFCVGLTLSCVVDFTDTSRRTPSPLRNETGIGIEKTTEIENLQAPADPPRGAGAFPQPSVVNTNWSKLDDVEALAPLTSPSKLPALDDGSRFSSCRSLLIVDFSCPSRCFYYSPLLFTFAMDDLATFFGTEQQFANQAISSNSTVSIIPVLLLSSHT